jgi:hypothetical protein
MAPSDAWTFASLLLSFPFVLLLLVFPVRLGVVTGNNSLLKIARHQLLYPCLVATASAAVSFCFYLLPEAPRSSAFDGSVFCFIIILCGAPAGSGG